MPHGSTFQPATANTLETIGEGLPRPKNLNSLPWDSTVTNSYEWEPFLLRIRKFAIVFEAINPMSAPMLGFTGPG